MRVALDARMAGMSGIGRYLRSLARALADLPEADAGDLRLDLWMNPDQDASWVPQSPRVAVHRLPSRMRVYSPSEWLGWGRALRSAGSDLLHVPHFNIPWRTQVPLVATLHDAVYWRFPSSTGSFAGGLYARLMLWRASRVADRVICVSRAAAADLSALLGMDLSKVDVVPHGPPGFAGGGDPEHARLLRDCWNAPDGYLLYVGNFLPHKGLPSLLRAAALLRAQGRDVKLVLAGPEEPRAVALWRESSALALDGAVVFAGQLDDRALAAAYAGARAVVCPSPWEGFGFPMIEAFAAGIPVVAVDGGAAPEVAGGAAILAPAGDVAALAEAILRVWSDGGLRERLGAAGRERLQAFSWAEAARRTLAAYRSALASPRASRQ